MYRYFVGGFVLDKSERGELRETAGDQNWARVGAESNVADGERFQIFVATFWVFPPGRSGAERPFEVSASFQSVQQMQVLWRRVPEF